MDQDQKNQVMKALGETSFSIPGFRDIRDVPEVRILSALKNRKNKACYIKAIYQELLPFNIECKLRDSEKEDKNQKEEIETIIEDLAEDESIHGILAFLMVHEEKNKDLLYFLFDKYLPKEKEPRQAKDTKPQEIDNKELGALKQEIKRLKKEFREQRKKSKEISGQSKRNDMIIHALNDQIAKKEEETALYEEKIQELTSLNKSLEKAVKTYKDKHDKAISLYKKEKEKHKNTVLEHKKKQILIIGLTFKMPSSVLTDTIIMTFMDELEIEDPDILWYSYYELWLIENEVSSYSLKQRLGKQGKKNNRLRRFKNPSEMITYLEGRKADVL